MTFDGSKTLEELEGEDWGNAPWPSYVVTTCHAMRQKPVRDLTDEELRLGIGQEMSLTFLVPTAIGRLEADPLASGDMYEGALLKNVMVAAARASLCEGDLQRLDKIVRRFDDVASEMDAAWRDECYDGIAEALTLYNAFRRRT